jgi:hypothetical protein
MKKFMTCLFCVSALAAGVASAASPYDVQLLDSFSVGKAELKAGDYKVEMQGDKAVFTNGKKSVAVPATLEERPAVRYHDHCFPAREAERDRSGRYAGQNHFRGKISGFLSGNPAARQKGIAASGQSI